MLLVFAFILLVVAPAIEDEENRKNKALCQKRRAALAARVTSLKDAPVARRSPRYWQDLAALEALLPLIDEAVYEIYLVRAGELIDQGEHQAELMEARYLEDR